MGHEEDFFVIYRMSHRASASGVRWQPHLYSYPRARALIGSVREGVSCLGCSRLRPALQFNYFIRLSHFLAGLV